MNVFLLVSADAKGARARAGSDVYLPRECCHSSVCFLPTRWSLSSLGWITSVMYVKFMSPPGQGRVKARCIMYQGCGRFALSARLHTAEMSSLCVGGFAVGRLRPSSVSACKTNGGCNSKRVVLSARLTAGPPSSPASTHPPAPPPGLFLVSSIVLGSEII